MRLVVVMTVDDVREEVAGHMIRIVSYFKPGVKITVLVRVPDFPDRDFMMTDDEIPALREMLDRREKAGQNP